MNNINIKIEKDDSDNINESHEEILKPSQVIQKFESINKEILLKKKQNEENILKTNNYTRDSQPNVKISDENEQNIKNLNSSNAFQIKREKIKNEKNINEYVNQINEYREKMNSSKKQKEVNKLSQDKYEFNTQNEDQIESDFKIAKILQTEINKEGNKKNKKKITIHRTIVQRYPRTINFNMKLKGSHYGRRII